MSDATPISSVNVDLYLLRSGKRRVEVPLAPAFADPKPLIVEVPPDTSGRETIASVKFEVREASGRSIPCSDFYTFKDRGELPIEVPILPGKPRRLPFGRWSIVTHSRHLANHFQPASFEIGHPEETIVIQLDVELVPVRLVARGYRGDSPIGGTVRTVQHGIEQDHAVRAEENFTIWLRPGETDWYFGSDRYQPHRWSEPVRSMPDGAPQTIEFDMELGESH